MPISRMRSVTLVSIMFMMPMPPTSSEIPETAPMMSWKDPIKLLSASMLLFIVYVETVSPPSSSVASMPRISVNSACASVASASTSPPSLIRATAL